jgi:hypothetical protein
MQLGIDLFASQQGEAVVAVPVPINPVVELHFTQSAFV